MIGLYIVTGALTLVSFPANREKTKHGTAIVGYPGQENASFGLVAGK